MRRLAVLLVLLIPLVAHSGARSSVALDLSGLDEAAFLRLDAVALEKSAAVRLVQEGFAVVSPSSQPTVALRLDLLPTGNNVVLAAKGPGGELRRDVLLSDESLAEFHLELVQKMVELARAAAREPSASPVRVLPAPGVAPAKATPPAPPGSSLFAGLGAELREGGVDPMLLAGLRYGHRVRFAAEVGLGGARGQAITVLEGRVAVGPVFALQLTEDLELELAGAFGVLLHQFQLDDPSAREPAGTRLSPVAQVPLTLSLWPDRRVTVGFRLAPGFSAGRSHLRGNEMLWSRGPLSLDAGLVLLIRP